MLHKPSCAVVCSSTRRVRVDLFPVAGVRGSLSVTVRRRETLATVQSMLEKITAELRLQNIQIQRSTKDSEAKLHRRGTS